MLWVALHFPQLRRQALARGHAPSEAESEGLAAVAAWACQFTPRVSLEPPRELLLEVEGSLRYYGGRWKFLARLRTGLTRLGFEARLAEAPTARAALWKVRGGGGRLEGIPVDAVGLVPEERDLVAGLGIETVGGLMRLPRDGIARRFGRRLLQDIDQACGRTAEAREFFIPPARFSARLELPASVTQAERTLFAAKRLLEQMEGFLSARHAGVRSFVLELLPDRDQAAATRIRLGLANPGRDAEHFLRLLRERLGQVALEAPVRAIRLEAAILEYLKAENRSLLRDAQAEGEQWQRLVERLAARLGEDAVHGIDAHPEHRPERAWRKVAPGQGSGAAAEEGCGSRPLWLLAQPRRMAEGEFALLAGPERIESGWWDGAEALRDYFIARTGEASLAWVYREREGSWFLHGYFA